MKKIRSRPKNLFEIMAEFDVGEQPTPIVCFVKEITHRYDENVTNNRNVIGLSVTIYRGDGG